MNKRQEKVGEERISIAMCTYNGEKYLRDQLDSILSQTHRNLELIIVDDCSSDNTLAILEKYSKSDDRIRVIKNSENLGFVRNFEKAIAACSGDLIALADQDDVWIEHKIESLVRDIGDNWLIYSRVQLMDMNGAPIDREFPGCSRVEGNCPLSLILKNCVTGHACLIRRELFELARPSLAKMPYHDQWLAIVAASQGKLKAGQEVLSYYRIHDDNAVMDAKRKGRSSKVQRASKKHEHVMALIKVVIESGLLAGGDQLLLEELNSLLSANTRVVFNVKLRAFLRQNREYFLRLADDQEKFIRKLCRGRRYFYLMPFS